jgi:SPP1 family predicted phage head-tail adaptor
MILPIGKLDRRITIEQATQGVGPFGEPVETWAALATVWANAYAGSGKEFVAARQINAEVSMQFQIRWIADLSTTMRILYDGKYFDIVDIAEVGRHERLNIFAKARQV